MFKLLQSDIFSDAFKSEFQTSRDLENSMRQEASPKEARNFILQFKKTPQKLNKRKKGKRGSISVIRRKSLKPITQLTKEQYRSLNNTLVNKTNTDIYYKKIDRKLQEIEKEDKKRYSTKIKFPKNRLFTETVRQINQYSGYRKRFNSFSEVV